MLEWLSVWSEVQTCIVAQLMPLPLTVSCFSEIQIGFTFLVKVHPVVPEKGSLNGCVCIYKVHKTVIPKKKNNQKRLGHLQSHLHNVTWLKSGRVNNTETSHF